MNLSRRKLLLGSAAIAVAPALPVEDLLPPTWVPNPASTIVIEPKSEIYHWHSMRFMTMERFEQLWGEELKRAYIEGPHPWRE
jgi:hypothetical protein